MNASFKESLDTLDVRRANAGDRLPIFRMLELYQHDLSDIWDQEIDAHGEYGYALDRYWREPSCHPFVALIGGHYAGFALVDTAVKVHDSGYWMDQFFILKKYRGSGLGKTLATRVFAELSGHWEIGQMHSNLSAQKFWRRVIAEYTDGQFTEHAITSGWWQGMVQCFEQT
jgi:predicted acetyltransferase